MMLAMKNYLTLFIYFLSLLIIPCFCFSQEQINGETSHKLVEPQITPLVESSPTEPQHHFPLFNEPLEEIKHESNSFQEKFFNMLFILAMLITFMIFAAWLLKKVMRTRLSTFNASSHIKILETRNLSPRSTLYLINVEGRSILISETGATVTHLATLSTNAND